MSKEQEYQYLSSRLEEPDFWINGSKLHVIPIKVIIGNNVIHSLFSGNSRKNILLHIDNTAYIDVILTQYGTPVFTMYLHNSKGDLVFKIVNNVIQLNSLSWDIEQIGNSIIVRESSRRILLNMDIDPDDKSVTIKANFRKYLSKIIKINEDGITVGNDRLLSNCTVLSSRNGIVITNQLVTGTAGVEGYLNASSCTIGGYPIGFKNVHSCTNILVSGCELAFLFEKKFLEDRIKVH